MLFVPVLDAETGQFIGDISRFLRGELHRAVIAVGAAVVPFDVDFVPRVAADRRGAVTQRADAYGGVAPFVVPHKSAVPSVLH